MDTTTQLVSSRGPGRREHALGCFLICAMTAGSVMLWIGIPAIGLWGLSKITDSPSSHLLAAVLLIPPLMFLFSPFLFWVNGLYLRVTGAAAEGDEDDEKRERLRGPLEPILLASMVAAATLLFIWVVFVAPHTPQLQIV